MPDEQDRIPVIWTRMGDEIVAVTITEQPLAGWTELLAPGLRDALSRITGSQAAGPVHVRTFTTRDVDLEFWDNAVRKGSDGYSYGMVWGEDSKFLKHLQFKEIPPPVSGAHPPPIDPAAMAALAALHQIQQTLERMEDRLDQVHAAVEWLEKRRQSRQAAELLSAASALGSVARRSMAAGVVQPEDLLRIAHLEQVVGTLHREICMELEDLVAEFSFCNAKQAKRARSLGSGRAADLVALDAFALEALRTWHQLMLLSKATSGRLAPGEVEETRRELKKLGKATVGAVARLKKVNTTMANRSILQYMSWKGIPAGLAEDRKLRHAAEAVRKEAQKRAGRAAKEIKAIVKSLDSMAVMEVGDPAPLRLMRGGEAA